MDMLQAAMLESGLDLEDLEFGGGEEETQGLPQQAFFQVQTPATPVSQPTPVHPNLTRKFITVQTSPSGQHLSQIIRPAAQAPATVVEGIPKVGRSIPTTARVAASKMIAVPKQKLPGPASAPTLVTLRQNVQPTRTVYLNKPVHTVVPGVQGPTTVLQAPTVTLRGSIEGVTSGPTFSRNGQPVVARNGQPSSSASTQMKSPVYLTVTKAAYPPVQTQLASHPQPHPQPNKIIIPSRRVVISKSQLPLSTGSASPCTQTFRVASPGSQGQLDRPVALGSLFRPQVCAGARDQKVILQTGNRQILLNSMSPGTPLLISRATLEAAQLSAFPTNPSPGPSRGIVQHSRLSVVSREACAPRSNSPVQHLGNIPTVVTQKSIPRNGVFTSEPRIITDVMRDNSFMNSKSPMIRDEDLAEAVEEESEELGHAETYADYKPMKVQYGEKHPDQVVESSSLASVIPPDVHYTLSLPEEVMDSGALSSLQLEAITYACQRHEQMLPSNERSGYFIGDGAGVGKGRTVAGIIRENYLLDRKKALWLSVSNDLKVDAERDLKDIGASNIKVYSLNKFKYTSKISSSENGSVKKGVLFLTYSSLIGESNQTQSKYHTRLKQIIKWFGKSYNGPIIFDECHKAKNLCPTGSGKATKTGNAVLELQKRLPMARIVYASATGATEPRNMAYMVRLGLWGEGTSFREFSDFINCVEKRGVGAMEMVAMEMKLSGMYIARQLSFKGVTFKIVESNMSKKFREVYDEATILWMEARGMFQKAADLVQADNRMRKSMWAQFWATHQRFFKHMCISSKVDHCVELAQDAVSNNMCVVIGLQSTGEARTQELVDQEGGDLGDFFSTAKGLFTNLVEKHFPAADRSKTLEFLGLELVGGNLKRKNDFTAGPSKRARLDEDIDDDEESSGDCDFSDLNESDSSSDMEESSDENSNPFAHSDDEDPWVKKSRKRKHKTPKAKKKTEPKKKSKKKRKWSDDDEEDHFCDRALASIRKRNSTAAILNNTNTDDDPDNERGMQQALMIKKELMTRVEALSLPHNTLDSLVDKLGGPSEVAEMTGRKGRVVQNDEGVQYESRSEVDVSLEFLNLKEKERFMDGDKNIAIISEAASSGISLHADRRAKNQKRRVHITLELPWSADRAIQQFGRTHRSNQMSAPEYIFLISDLAGEQRFASTVAKRLESLGALTHGDRRATESRDLSRFNIDNRYGRQALETMMKSILSQYDPIVDPPKGYTMLRFCDEVKDALEGVGLITITDRNTKTASLEKDYNNISKFLNRLLGMPTGLQNALFEYFSNTLAAIILDAKRLGRWDMGILDLGSGQEIVKKLETKMFVGGPATNPAKTELSSIQVERGMDWSSALNLWRKCKSVEEGFYRSNHERNQKHTAILVALQGRNKKGEKVYHVYRPNTGRQPRTDTLADIKKKYKKVMPDEAEKWWQAQYDSSATQCVHSYWNGNCKRGMPCELGLRTRKYHVLSGSVLSVWTSVETVFSSMPGGTASKMQVVRLKTGVDEKIVGSLIPANCVAPLINVLSTNADKTVTKDFTLQAAVNGLNPTHHHHHHHPHSPSSSSTPSSSSSSSSTHNGLRTDGKLDNGGQEQAAASSSSSSSDPPRPPPPPLLSMPMLCE
ncbi:hypothetical protein ACOMHN_038337 [Nucella lapillus]